MSSTSVSTCWGEISGRAISTCSYNAILSSSVRPAALLPGKDRQKRWTPGGECPLGRGSRRRGKYAFRRWRQGVNRQQKGEGAALGVRGAVERRPFDPPRRGQ